MANFNLPLRRRGGAPLALRGGSQRRSSRVSGAAQAPLQWPSARTGWYTTIVLAIAYFLSYMDRAIIGLLVGPIKTDLQLSDTELGLVTGFSFAVFYALAGIALGRLADNGNRKYLVTIAIATWSAMTALCGLTMSFGMLFLARVGVGVGEAGLNPAASSIISDLFPPRRRHFAITTFNVGGSLGGGLAFVLGAGLLALAETMTRTSLPFLGLLKPWQWTFLIVSTPGFALAALVYLTFREPIRRGTGPMTEQTVPVRDIVAYFRMNGRCFAGLFLAPAFMYMINLGYLVWGPAMFVRVHGLDLKFVGAVFGGSILLCAVTGKFLCAALVRRYEQKGYTDGPLRTLRLIAAIAAPFVCFGALIPNPYIAMAALAPGIGLLVATAVLPNIAIQTIVPNRLRGQSVALFLLGVNLIGGGLGPLVIALLTDNVFGNENLIHYSMTTLAIAVLPLALIAYHWALPGYRETASRA